MYALAHTPVRLHELKPWLALYPNQEDANILYQGFSDGFKIQFEGKREAIESKNHGSALSQPRIVKRKLTDEVVAGRVAGPFQQKPLSNLRVSPLGLVNKSTPGEFRLIFDLSYPETGSVNEGIPQEFSSVQYTNFDAVTNMVKSMGQGSFLFKIDIRSAFRLLPLHPADFSLMGMKHDNAYYVDKALPFGCATSCAIFEKFSTFLEFCAKKAAGKNEVIHYLDDFCGGNLSMQEAEVFLKCILALFDTLGVPVAPEKIEGPSTTIKFLGLLVDTINMEVRLPADKVLDLKSLIRQFTAKKRGLKVSLREIQSLIGKLNFACRAIVPGRAFIRRLIDATRHAKKPHHKIRITAAMKDDLNVWDQFLSKFNGRSVMFDEAWIDSDSMDLYTDAAGGIGFGAYFQGRWAHGLWPEDWLVDSPDITFKELLPIAVALCLWSEDMTNKKIIFHCDNEAVVHIVNKQSSRSPPSMSLMRMIVLSCLSNNVLFKAIHVPGRHNKIADALSRQQFHRFRALAPEAEPAPTPIPQQLVQLLKPK